MRVLVSATGKLVNMPAPCTSSPALAFSSLRVTLSKLGLRETTDHHRRVVAVLTYLRATHDDAG